MFCLYKKKDFLVLTMAIWTSVITILIKHLIILDTKMVHPIVLGTCSELNQTIRQV